MVTNLMNMKHFNIFDCCTVCVISTTVDFIACHVTQFRPIVSVHVIVSYSLYMYLCLMHLIVESTYL